MMLAPGTRVHIVGIGGAGMSGVATLLHERGLVVTGSDAQASAAIDALRERGVTVFVGHDASHSEGAAVVLWSPAVALDHVEIEAARANGAQLLQRAELLEALGEAYRVVGLTGTHGKTTATSMMAYVFAAAHRDASRLLGAAVRGLGGNGHDGTSGELLLEVDESYGTFGRISPYALGVLNVEPDHLDHYGTFDALRDAFVSLVERTLGPVVLWTDDSGARDVDERAQRSTVTVGREPPSMWRVRDEQTHRDGSSFVLEGDEEISVTLAVSGAHNVANAAVVAVLAHQVGIAPEAISAGLAAFPGAPRRFERRGRLGTMDVVEDYAHLPGEIAATIQCAKDLGYERIAAIFQPHRVTRTVAIGEGFAPAFDGADVVVIADLYTAGEANPQGITGAYVATPLATRRNGVFYAPTFDDVRTQLATVEADIVLLLGAGDIATVLDDLPGLTR